MFRLEEIVAATGGILLGKGTGSLFTGISIDSRTVKPGELFVALRGERFDGNDFIGSALSAGASGILFSSDYDSSGSQRIFIKVKDTLSALQEIARFHRSKFDIPFIAVTGSNGKTTTKEMAAAVLGRRFRLLKNEGNLNNHIGVPLTLLRLQADHQAAIIEMGINHGGELVRLCEIAQPQVGLITNIGPAHLEFLGSLDGVAKAKSELLQGLPDNGVSILNADDEYFRTMAAKAKGEMMTFGFGPEATVRASEVRLNPGRGFSFRMTVGGGLEPDTVEISLRVMGRHNIYNALGAAAAALSQKMSLAEIRQGLEAFEPFAMRSQLLQLGEYRVFNDAYNANPASMRSALETLGSMGSDGQKIAVLGDMLELGRQGPEAHRSIGEQTARLGIDYLFTLGDLAAGIAEGAVSAGMPKNRVFRCGDAEEAGRLLLKVSRAGDYILLKGSRKMKMERILDFIAPSG